MERSVQRSDVSRLSPPDWFAKLVSSASEASVDGLRYPGFPDEGVQRQFVGSSNAAALGEGSSFYQFVLSHLRGLRYRFCGARGYLDFGAGWGRIGRFFLRDFERSDMFGVDIDAGMVEFCKRADLPGAFLQIENGKALPFEKGRFRLVTAYSVFTHLPPALFAAWMAELLRVLAPGGMLVFTVESLRFLDFIETIDPETTESEWHKSLAGYKSELTRMRSEVDAGGIAYMATGGGDVRTPEVYGEAVVSRAYLENLVKPYGRLVDYIDDGSRFWQAVVVVQRTGRP
jgi:SAM-dependent methyltransferase